MFRTCPGIVACPSEVAVSYELRKAGTCQDRCTEEPDSTCLATVPDQQSHSSPNQLARRNALHEPQVMDDSHVIGVFEIHDLQDGTHGTRLKRRHVHKEPVEVALEGENFVPVGLQNRLVPRTVRPIPMALIANGFRLLNVGGKAAVRSSLQ